MTVNPAAAAGAGFERGLEQEWKFDVDPDFDPPDLRPVVGRTERLPEQRLRTTYFDTADLRLWAQGITLRHRSDGPAEAGDSAGGGGAGDRSGKWTLKLPEPDRPGTDESGLAARTEWSWKGDPDRIPAGATAIVAGLVRRSPLRPVTTLETTRRRLLLHAEDGPWAEIDDDLAEVVEGTEAGLRFRQLEIELVDGAAVPAGQLEGVLAELRRSGVTPSGRSKFALAAGLPEAADRGVVAAGAGLSGADLAGMVGGRLTADLAVLLARDYHLRTPDGPSADAVHGARVAVRRLRTDVMTFGAALDPVWAAHVRRDLKWVSGLLGRLRDADELVRRLRSHREPGDADEVEELVRLVHADRHLDATELAEALAGDRYRDLLERLQAAAAAPPLLDAGGVTRSAPAATVAARMVRPRLHSLDEEMVALGSRPSDRDLHQVRIRAKRLRYAAEAVEPYVGRRARRTASAAEGLADLLGDINDAANGARRLRELACHPSVTPTVAFVAGRIAGRADARAGVARARWRKVAARLASPKRRAWLD